MCHLEIDAKADEFTYFWVNFLRLPLTEGKELGTDWKQHWGNLTGQNRIYLTYLSQDLFLIFDLRVTSMY